MEHSVRARSLSRARVAIRRAAAVVAFLTVGAVAACSSPPEPPTSPASSADGPLFEFRDAGTGIEIRDGDDWSMPASARPAKNSGFFSEDAATEDHVFTRSIDVSWRQIQPGPGAVDRLASGEAQGMDFDGLDDQLASPDRFWMRIFASGESWAPKWVADECGVTSYGPDYDGERHLPLWNECVWGHLLDTYRQVFIDGGLADDPRLAFVYVPGAFTWAEYDYDMVAAAVDAGDLDLETYLAWYDHAWSDLAELFGEQANKLVFTGEDYPFGPFGVDDDLLAAQAVDAGLGIRSGLSELSNFHLSEAPAYGSRILPNGHLFLDDTLPVHDGSRIVAAEHECYNDCGYATDDPYYAVRQSNLKALQLRTNWIYVVPGESYFDEYPEHWDWVRLSMGATAETSMDAWTAMRDAEDTYWSGDHGELSGTGSDSWATRPWIRNLERWLVQVDAPGSVAHRSDADTHTEVLQVDNGTAHEGLSTNTAGGDTGFVFEVDSRFAAASGACVVKVTYLDAGAGGFRVDVGDWASPTVQRVGDGVWKTATFALPSAVLEKGHSFRISLAEGAEDLTARFVRVVRSE